MKPRDLCPGVAWRGYIDWDRRQFDALIPLPEGTSYNAYLVRGAEKTALIDSCDAHHAAEWLADLADVPQVDYLIAQHSEQDHSGALPLLLARYPQAVVLASPQGKTYLQDLLHLPPERVRAVKEGETLALGGKTLRFLLTPWVHWPDTMCTLLEEDRILFTCDFFGSHLATSDLYAHDKGRVYGAAQLYYAQIMMPYGRLAAKNVEKVAGLGMRVIAPSHGPLYDRPAFILDAWRAWTSGTVARPLTLVVYVSMHDSTRQLARRLTDTLIDRGLRVAQFDLTATDLGRLAAALVEAKTLLLGTPATLNGPHPLAAQAAGLVNALKPPLQRAALFGSYGWGATALSKPEALLPDLALEWLPAVLCKGAPRAEAFAAIEQLAQTVSAKA